MNLKTFKQRVAWILERSEKARNNDGYLYAQYINKFENKYVFEIPDPENDGKFIKVIALKSFEHLPPSENIRRPRQIIQNNDNKYLPTEEKVRKARNIKELNWTNIEVREAKLLNI